MNYPFNDDAMLYDYKKHQYVLTERYVLETLGVNLSLYLDGTGDENPSTLGQRILKRVSDFLYRYIYAHGNNKDYIEYLLAKYPPCRDIIKDCLVDELYYQLRNGDFFNSVDVATAFNRWVSPTTQMRLQEELPNGVCLVYQGRYNTPKIDYRSDY
ncbi:MAG: hypothetical protein ACI4MZ_01290 [Christensenellales bacterium]